MRLLADQGGYTFYVIEVRGRYPTRCFATGRAWKPRLFGSMVCPIPGRRPEPGSFPSAEHPVLDQSAFDPRSGQPRVFRLVGFAAVAVKKVGLLTADGDVIATVPIVNSTYLKTTGLPAKGAEAIVAFDGSGRRVYCEDIAADDPCGNRQTLEHVTAPPPSPPQPEPPQVRRGALVQRGESQGVSVSIYKPGVAFFDIISASARLSRLATGASAGCLRVRFLNGRWLSDDLGVSVGAGAVGRVGDRLRIDLAGGRPYSLSYAVPPPYDGCEINGVFGRRRNDAFGTRAPVEIPLSEAGRLFFNDRAAARDLAYFVRSKRVQQIRLNSSPRAGLEALARRYPHRVVGLQREDQFAPEDKIGFWIGPGTIRFTTTSSTGRRFFVTAEQRTLKLPRNNLGDLALVF